jgi:hypothetical protein
VTAPQITATAAHARVVDEAWEGLVGGERVTGVQSPPGAGKSASSELLPVDGRPTEDHNYRSLARPIPRRMTSVPTSS